MTLSDEQTSPAILLAGPTASGKSALAMAAAEAVDGVIINADSMQVYPVLSILTARPGENDTARVPHRLYGTADISKPYSVAMWLAAAKDEAMRVWADGKVPIFVGGTGLYFRALEEGLANTPDIEPTLRNKIRRDLIDRGSEALYAELLERDPEGAERLRPSDGQRIARALEVVLQTGQTLFDFQAKQGAEPFLKSAKVLRYLIMPERAVLHERINSRADWMLENGAIEEVEALLNLNLPPEATALKAIGVQQIRDLVSGKIDQMETLNRLKAATRQYAKRQCTWFRGQLRDNWKVLFTNTPAPLEFASVLSSALGKTTTR